MKDTASKKENIEKKITIVGWSVIGLAALEVLVAGGVLGRAAINDWTIVLCMLAIGCGLLYRNKVAYMLFQTVAIFATVSLVFFAAIVIGVVLSGTGQDTLSSAVSSDEIVQLVAFISIGVMWVLGGWVLREPAVMGRFLKKK